MLCTVSVDLEHDAHADVPCLHDQANTFSSYMQQCLHRFLWLLMYTRSRASTDGQRRSKMMIQSCAVLSPVNCQTYVIKQHNAAARSCFAAVVHLVVP